MEREQLLNQVINAAEELSQSLRLLRESYGAVEQPKFKAGDVVIDIETRRIYEVLKSKEETFDDSIEAECVDGTQKLIDNRRTFSEHYRSLRLYKCDPVWFQQNKKVCRVIAWYRSYLISLHEKLSKGADVAELTDGIKTELRQIEFYRDSLWNSGTGACTAKIGD